MGNIKVETIAGKSIKYSKLTAEPGHCFYNVNEEERIYLTQIFTPVTDINILKETYISIIGNMDELNKELETNKEINDERINN